MPRWLPSYQTLRTSPLRYVAGPLYNRVIWLELAYQRALDLFSGPRTADRDILTQCTAVIKTFERPHTLRRLLKSLQRHYPGLPVIVVDDSRQPAEVPGAELIRLPYDSGLSAGRRAGLQAVTTPYMLNLDDDFVFFRKSGLVRALRAMEAEAAIDIQGGKVINLPFFDAVDYRRSGLFPNSQTPVLPPGTLLDGLPVYEKVANFFIARTERLRLVDWDPALRLVEHTDFFTRARGILTTVYNQDFRCLHAPTLFDRSYMDRRSDYAIEQAILQRRYYGRSDPGEGR